MSGLVQDYSKSPIKPQRESIIPTTQHEPAAAAAAAAAAVPNALDQTFVPATLGQQQQAPPSANIYRPANAAPQYSSTIKPTPVDFGAPPRKSMDGRRSGEEVSRQAVVQPGTGSGPNTDHYQQQQQQQQQQTYASSQFQGTNNHLGPAGYRQNPMHDGGSTDYSSPDGQTGLEYAEQAWSSASKTVGEFAGTAGDTVGKAWRGGLGSVKGWLNPESKGMR